MRELKVGVLGAAGTIAPAILGDLAISAEVSSVVALDLNYERARDAAAAHGGDKTTARAADARAGLASELDGLDILINTASYRVNLDAMEACLAAGCDYLDLGGLYWVTKSQLELADRFERAGRLALLGVGSSPGKTNLMAARAMRELDSADSIDVVAGGRDFNPPGGFSPPYAVQTLLDEVTLKPVVLRDGEAVEIEPLTSGGEVDFGEPIGHAQTIYTLHSELVSFGPSFGCRECSFRLSLAPAVEDKLRESLARNGLGPPDRGPRRGARGPRPLDHPTLRAIRHRWIDRVHGDAGCCCGPPARAGADRRDRGPFPRAVHRSGRDVCRARDAQL
jgi:saccharopine dehydrogenase-like NADP-dependent oxidoreductase